MSIIKTGIIEKCLITDKYIGIKRILIAVCKNESNAKDYYFIDSSVEVKVGSTYKITFEESENKELDIISAEYLY